MGFRQGQDHEFEYSRSRQCIAAKAAPLMTSLWNHPPRRRFDLSGGNPMFDKFGRLLCPTCGEPMTPAAKFDSHREGAVRTAFACESCEAVMMLTGQVSPAEAKEQRAA